MNPSSATTVSTSPSSNRPFMTSRRGVLTLVAVAAGGIAVGTWSGVSAHADGTDRDSPVLGVDRPDYTTTGLLPGSELTITDDHSPASDTTYTNLDVRNNVVPDAAVGNVTYKDCLFRGPSTTPTGISSLYTMYRPHRRGFTFIDCTFCPQTPDFRWVGLQGYGFTLRRCYISQVVDQVEVFNPNDGPGGAGDDSLRDGPSDVVIEQCYFHNNAYWGPETDTGPARDGSHCDNIQWEGCTGLVVRGNYFTGLIAPWYQPNYRGGTTTNSAMMIKPDAGNLGNGVITKNWFGGGAVTINVADAPANNRYIDDVGTLTGNRFYRDQSCAPTVILIATSKRGPARQTSADTSGNVFDDNDAAVPVTRHNS